MHLNDAVCINYPTCTNYEHNAENDIQNDGEQSKYVSPPKNYVHEKYDNFKKITTHNINW